MENMPSNLKKIKESICTLKDKVDLCKFSILEVNNDIKKMESIFNNYLKSLEKPKKKIKRGFSKPSLISNELSDFLNLPNESKIPRTEVTKLIIDYVKNKNLQDNENKQVIIPDNKLKELLCNNDEKITYFTIQKYLNKHFLK